jgi:hypothetical protein
MKRRLRRRARAAFPAAVALAWLAGAASPARAVELALLAPDNWARLAPKGKEADAIFGDFVLQNDRATLVVAFPRAHRDANFAARGVGGSIIDLEVRDAPSDQLTAFYPGGGALAFDFAWASAAASTATAATAPRTRLEALRRAPLHGQSISLAFVAHPDGHAPEVQVVYTLTDGAPVVEVRTTYTNLDDLPVEVEPADRVRVDFNRDAHAVDRAPAGETSLYWAYDRWFGQAYGVVADKPIWVVHDTSAWREPTLLGYGGPPGERRTVVKGQPLHVERRLIAGRDLLAVKAIADRLAGLPQRPARLAVRDAGGAPVADADVEVQIRDQLYGRGRTDARGEARFALPGDEDAVAVVSAIGHGERRALFPGDAPPGAAPVEVRLDQAGWIEIDVREGGQPVPCKVQLFGRYGTRDPTFGPDHGETWVLNAVHLAGAVERHKLDPGRYDAIVSHGPEYDAVFTSIEVTAGATTTLRADLQRSVDTTGWISADFHNHSTESGDNITSQRGRVRALLAEHIEFAPCTEHNRVSSYTPHLTALGATARMATCSGVELTGSTFSIGHQNAFPLIEHPHTQGNGAPQPSPDVDLQIERLALWDDKSEKLLQQNHPTISELFFDQDLDGVRDAGHARGVGFIDVIEVHPPEAIFWTPLGAAYPPHLAPGLPYDNRIFGWLQTLNLGRRIPGVVNTDAHHNFHETGWLRNFVRSPTDDPARVRTLDVVREARKGHLTMTNGPFLEVALAPTAADLDGGAGALPGDDVRLPDGRGVLRVRVQAPNWLDVDRVQVFVNGRPDRALNFSRARNPEMFGRGVVKFDRRIPLALKRDAHVIVAVIGEHSVLGPVVGPDRARDRPVALANPIFADVDGGGFRANGDLLDGPVIPPKRRPRQDRGGGEDDGGGEGAPR